MIRLFGEITLYFALFFACTQSFLPLWGYWHNNPYLRACARTSAWGQFIFIIAAYLLLTIAFARNDFSIAYVAANSHTALPLLYKLTATWGGHEGSILLWILILNGWTIAYSILDKNNHSDLVLALLGLLSFSFLSFLLLTSNPFIASIGNPTGHDLNPLLQDPGFVIHPPMLYLGYVGFSAAFAISLAALIRNQLDRRWAHLTLAFAMPAWCFLTLGITLGSWWAYRVLGWGGFWFWDPVENASLLPWLAGTGLIHLLVLVEKRNIGIGFAAFLALITFALSLLGTFLVRSGVLISAHNFASDPARGVFLLGILALLLTAVLCVYLMRLSQLAKFPLANLRWCSREMALLINSSLLFIAMCTILLGTLYPLILDALHLGTISVGAPYFNSVMRPFVLLIMFFMGIAPLLAWQTQLTQETLARLKTKLVKNFLFSTLAALILLWSIAQHIELGTLFSLIMSIWIILSVLPSLRFLPAMSLAHLGFALLVMGIMMSSLLSEEAELRLRPGQAAHLGPYQFFFIDTQYVQGANYRGVRGTFEVLKNTRHITNLYPEKRIYPVREMVMTKVDIHPSIFRDLYIALGEPLTNNEWSVRLYYKPFIRFIWFGGLIMILGGIAGLYQRKYKNNK